MNSPQNNFINAKPGTLWEIKNGLRDTIIPLWLDPEIGRRIVFGAFWTDYGHFMKLGVTKTLHEGNKSEKVIFFSREKNDVAVGYITQLKCKFLIPYEDPNTQLENPGQARV